MELSSYSEFSFRGFKIKLKPTEKQKELFQKYFHMHRFCYNWTLAQQEYCFNNFLFGDGRGRYESKFSLAKELVGLKSQPGFEWLREYDSYAEKMAVFNACDVAQQFVDAKGYLKVKYLRKRESFNKGLFFLRYEVFHLGKSSITAGRKIGVVRTERHNFIDTGDYRYITITFDGTDYWVSGLIRELKSSTHFEGHQSEPIGIDIGATQHNWIVDSTDTVVEAPDVSKLEKRIRKAQARVSKKRAINNKTLENQERRVRPLTKREKKARCKWTKLLKRRKNIFRNAIYNYTLQLVRRDPSCIVIEDLNSLVMMHQYKESHPGQTRRGKFFTKDILNARIGEFTSILTQRCNAYKIPLIKASPDYPSTQLCSQCGHRFTGENKLTMKDRFYICPICGNTMNRDKNSSLNLKYLGYSISEEKSIPSSHYEYQNMYERVV